MSEEFISALSQDVEYRCREIIQEAAKFMCNAKRTKMSVDDINYALEARNVEVFFILLVSYNYGRDSMAMILVKA